MSVYTINRPITGEHDPRIDPVCSRHRSIRTLAAAMRREMDAARRQGGRTERYPAADTRPLTEAERDQFDQEMIELA